MAEPVFVRVPVFGGRDDGALRYVKQERLHEFEPAMLYDDAHAPVGMDDVYVMRWQLTDPSKPESIEGRWVAVLAQLILDEIAEYARSRPPEAHADEARGVKLCEHGQHQWTEWAKTPRGNSTRNCTACGITVGSIF